MQPFASCPGGLALLLAFVCGQCQPSGAQAKAVKQQNG